MRARSVTEIAIESGLSVSGVYDLKNGYTKEPRGMAAVRLHEMIAKVGSGDTAAMKEAA